MRRGRWRTDASLRRYAKETRILSELQKINQHVLTFGKKIMDHLESLILGEVGVRQFGPLPKP